MDKVSNPLRIFTQKEIETLDLVNFKYYKKKHLGFFQFSDEKQLKINGDFYSEEELLVLFSELETNLNSYIALTKASYINDFLINGNINIFTNPSALEQIEQLPQTEKSKILDILANAIGDKLVNTLRTDPNFLHKLRLIFQFVNKRGEDFQTKSYQKFYSFLLKNLQNFELESQQPFVAENSLKYKSIINAQGSTQFFQIFDYCPETFKKISLKYLICFTKISEFTLKKEKSSSKFPIKTIETLREMTFSIHKHYDTEASQKLLLKLNTYLNRNKREETHKEKNGFNFKIFGSIIVGILLVYKLGSNLYKVNSIFFSNEDEKMYNFEPKIERKNKNEIFLENQLDEFARAKNSKYSSNILSSKPRENKELLSIEVNQFPTQMKMIHGFIPIEKLSKAKNKPNYELEFKLKDIPNVRIKAKVEYNETSMSFKYPSHNEDEIEEKDRSLTVKYTNYKKQTLTGIFQRQKAGKITIKKTFHIYFEDGHYKLQFEGEEKTVSLEENQIGYMKHINEIKNDQAILAGIIYNMKLFENKRIKKRRFYRMDRVYNFNIQTDPDGSISYVKPKFSKGQLNFYEAINISPIDLFQIKLKGFRYKYFVHRKTRKVLGIQMQLGKTNDNIKDYINVFIDDVEW